MRSFSRVDSSTLGWVKTEIDQTLADAREALQQYRDGEDDPTLLRAFNSNLHQVAGTLQMVELDGACQLAQEIESLASAVIADKLDGAAPEAAGLLDQGVDQLSAYMERLASGAPDRPLDNVEFINEMRRVRGAEEMDGYALFRPELAVYPAREEPAEELDGQEYFQRMRELRQQFQAGLLRWLRDQGDDQAWQTLADVMAELFRRSRFQVSMQIWWVARAYLDALRHAELSRHDPRKHTLAKLDLLLRTLSQEGEAAIAREGSENLVRYMLYHIGTSKADTRPIRDAVELFELDTLLGEEPAGRVALPDSSTLAALKVRIAEPLSAVQTALDEYARGDTADEAFAACETRLQAIADEARELGVGEVTRLSEAVRASLFGDGASRPAEDTLMAAARALLFIEQTLDSPEIGADWRREAAVVLERLSAGHESPAATSLDIESHEVDTDSLQGHELSRLVTAVAGEVKENLKEAEQNLERVARDPGDTDSMTAVVSSLQQVHGAVRMLGLHKLCDLLESAMERIRELIAGESFPGGTVLDALAVTIGTTEAYVKGLERDAPNLDVMLDRAVRELEAAESDDNPVFTDPGETLRRIDNRFDAWMSDHADYQAFDGLRRSLRDLGALARQQDRTNLQGIAQEMIKLLDIVRDDPDALNEEVEGTLRRSLATLEEQGEAMTAPAAAPSNAEADAPDEPVEVDEITRQAFSEEARECLADIDTYLQALRGDPGDRAALADMRRGFHTIKGSGRMARASDIAELAWVVEDVLNGLLDSGAGASEPLLDFVSAAREELSSLLQRGLDSDADLPAWRRAAAALAAEPADDAVSEAVDVYDQEGALSPPAAQGDTGADPAIRIDGFREEAWENAAPTGESERGAGEPISEPGGAAGDPQQAAAADRDDTRRTSSFADDEVIRIFSKEALSHLATIRAAVDECRHNGEAGVDKELLRAVHTLQGNARSLHLVEMSEAFGALDRALSGGQSAGESHGAVIRGPRAELLDELLVTTAKVLDHLNRDKRFPEVVRQELEDIAHRIGETWNDSGNADEEPGPFEGLDFASDFATSASDAHAARPGESAMSLVGSVFDDLVAPDTREETELLHWSPGDDKPVVREAEGEENTGVGDSRPADAGRALEAAGPGETPGPGEANEEAARGEALAEAELKDVFVEEASDTLSRIESALQQARRAGLDTEVSNTLKRELHTLKGSSRAAGVDRIGDLSHDAETMLEQIPGASDPPVDLLAVLEEVHDTLANMVQGLEEARIPEPDPGLVERLRGDGVAAQERRGSAGPAPSLIPEEGEWEDEETAHDVEAPPPVAATPSQAEDEAPVRSESAGRPTGGRSTVRIHSNVLDRLVNYAGEVSISRAQLEEQLSGLKSNLSELRGNVARFADQVRELDIQADTQIRSRVSEEKVSDSGDFDPLEMDRYSRLQQLSRSLSESVEDLATIQSGLNRFAVQTEGVLSQQAMLNTELQEGLMSARMVPFNTLVPRLRHQARRTARELDKDIDFSVSGGELEVDRNILDQISEALEHMIRNSLDHGIEPSAARTAAGKPARGTVRIECRQEGSEVVLTFSDDGAGLDVERIKARAVEAGLLSADSDLSDEEVIQLVVLSGFSTAPVVTQLSGRGVGLDVVNDAVRRLGGTLSMENRPGEGVSFELRLPLSLSITQAMFVRCGEQRFAVPLGVIDAVMKAEPESFSETSQDGDPLFKHDDRLYTLMDLTATLGLEPVSTSRRIPVLLVRMGAREVAVRVDEFVGTDEIVVKQLGDHLGRLSGFNGATVTGDGSVVLILDIAELWLAQERLPAFKHEAPRSTDAPPRVMVVDDSLTVRKVTGRNLGRHGMEVIMARDGVDALDQLAKVRPDVMLVDIEMPRMDGYELTTRIREDVNLRDIPIIVITSRAGTKHRDKAMELGADAYLTKPYQERELLDEVNALLKRASQPAAVH